MKKKAQKRSNVVDAYIEAGHEVVVVDNLNSSYIKNINKAATFYLADIRSKEMDKIFEVERPDVVNHHAAAKLVNSDKHSNFIL